MLNSATLVALASFLSSTVFLPVVVASPHHHHDVLSHQHLHQRRGHLIPPTFETSPSASAAVEAMAASASDKPKPEPDYEYAGKDEDPDCEKHKNDRRAPLNPPTFETSPSASAAVHALAAEASNGPDPIPAGAPPPLKPDTGKSKAAAPAPKKEAAPPKPKPEAPKPETPKPKTTAKKGKAPKVAKATYLGYAHDKSFNPATYRDGGGGGCINGKCIIGFSDSTTCAGGYVTPYGGGKEGVTKSCKSSGPLGMASFVHNSFTLLDCAGELGKKSPAASLHDFGNLGSGNSNFSKAVLGPVTPEEKKMGGDFAIWPNSNLVSLPTGIKKHQLLGVYAAVNMNGGTKPTDLYTTLATIDVPASPKDIPNGQVLKGNRIVRQLWLPHQPQYGKFALLSSHTIPGAAKHHPYLYLFAAVKNNPKKGQSALKVARVPASKVHDKKSYEFYCGASQGWTKTIPKTTDTASNIFVWEHGELDTGEIFYSKKHDSLVLVFQKFGGFYISEIQGGKFTQQKSYAAPKKFFEAKGGEKGESKPEGLIYAGHVYPEWDITGEKLLISWAVDVNWIGMGVVEWA